MKRMSSPLIGLLIFLGTAQGQPITPKEPLALFNGKDLSNFYTWLGSPGVGQPFLGKNNDPLKVFTVKDGILIVSGKVFGAITTEKEYENYHLVVEFRWAEATHAPRADRARDSGILLHCVGDDGGPSGKSFWMESVECQLIEGGTGDFILVGGKNKPALTVEAEERGKQLYYKPGAPAVYRNAGRINWFARSPEWKDAKGFRGKDDLEKPVGEWNTVECICDGDRITLKLNGQVVNAGTNSSHKAGKLQFQSEGAEIHFRKIELRPLSK
jgi:hypothetical protein